MEIQPYNKSKVELEGKKLKVTLTVKLKLWSVRHDIVYVVQRVGQLGNEELRFLFGFVHIVPD